MSWEVTLFYWIGYAVCVSITGLMVAFCVCGIGCYIYKSWEKWLKHSPYAIRTSFIIIAKHKKLEDFTKSIHEDKTGKRYRIVEVE